MTQISMTRNYYNELLNRFLKAIHHIDVLVQERHNSIANKLELSLSCSNSSIYCIALRKRKYW